MCSRSQTVYTILIISGKDKSKVWYDSIPFLEEKEDGLYIKTTYTYFHKETFEGGIYAEDRRRVLMNSPFVCADHCTFAGEYLGLQHGSGSLQSQ